MLEHQELQQILKAALDGDARAYNIICQQYEVPLRRMLATTFMGSGAIDHSDIRQSTFRRFFHELKCKKIEIRDPQDILAYLIRIARNLTIDVYRKRAVVNVHSEKLFHFLMSTQGDESAEIAAERSDLVDYLTHSLSDEERTVIDLHLEEEMTFREIGSILDISASAAQKQFERVIKKLRLKLK